MKQKTVNCIIVGDETDVRVEDLPSPRAVFFLKHFLLTAVSVTTMEYRGKEHVPIRSSGKDRQMFTVWLSSMMERDGDVWVC